MMAMKRLLAIVTVLIPLGCGTELSTEPDLLLTPEELIARGWNRFTSGLYNEAVDDFTRAHNGATLGSLRSEALNGRGWSYAYRREFTRARSDFTLALNIVGSLPPTRTDVRAGLAFVLFSLKQYNACLNQAQNALIENPNYQFAHDARVTARRLRLLIAQAAFAEGLFNEAASALDQFDPASAPHSNDPVALLLAIQRGLNSL